MDLITGIRKSKKNGDFTQSHLLRKTADKMVLYYALIFLMFLLDIISCLVLVEFDKPDFPFISAVLTFALVGVEAYSVWESADKKKQKQIKNGISATKNVIHEIKETINEIKE
jgi:hypothetical protein